MMSDLLFTVLLMAHKDVATARAGYHEVKRMPLLADNVDPAQTALKTQVFHHYWQASPLLRQCLPT